MGEGPAGRSGPGSGVEEGGGDGREGDLLGDRGDRADR